MEISLFKIIFTIVNFAILAAVIIGIYKAIQAFKDYIFRNKEMDKKIDMILNKLENKEDN